MTDRTQTNVAVLECKQMQQQCDEALTHEEQQGAPWYVSKARRIDGQLYGFELPETLQKQQAFDAVKKQRLEQIKSYRNHAHNLRSLLKNAGVEPLAVITTKAWEQILRRSGLYVLQPDSAGQIRVSREPIQRLRARAEVGARPCAILIGVATCFVWASLVVRMSQWLEWPVGWMVFVGAVASAVGYVLADISADAAYRKWIGGARYRRLVDNYLRTFDWRGFLQDLTSHDSAVDQYVGRASGDQLYVRQLDGMPRTVILPPAPERTVTIMRALKEKRQDFSIAAVPEAFTFAGGMRTYFEEGLVELKERERALAADPIIFVQYGSATAIVDQFGPWLLEEKAMQEVFDSEHLL